MREERYYVLGAGWVALLFLYCAVLALAGIALAAFALMPDLAPFLYPQMLHRAIAGAAGMALVGGAVSRMVTLYRYTASPGAVPLRGPNSRLRRVGAVSYHAAQPLVAVGLALFVVAGLYFIWAAFDQFQTEEGEAAVNMVFVTLVMFIAAWCGFAELPLRVRGLRETAEAEEPERPREY